MSIWIGQDYTDPLGQRVTVVDIYDSWRKDTKSTSVALIERPSGKALRMSLQAFLATYSAKDVKSAN